MGFRRTFTTLVALAAVGAALGLYITRPKTVAAEDIAGLTGDVALGETVFWAGGCASCHAAPDSEDKLILAGGKRFTTEFGTFIAPNISNDSTHGIGGWSDLQLLSALRHGTGARGEHLYPAFPYATYAKAEMSDLVSLVAYLRTLPADPTPSADHEIGFPFNIRASLGGWKLLFLNDDWVMPASGPVQERGRYLVESLAHCGECHTPRNALGGLDTGNWFAGAPNPSGKGKIPNITPAHLDWSETDIAAYLGTGFTPEYDSAGGSMADVVTSMSKLTPDDLAAIAAYVTATPPID